MKYQNVLKAFYARAWAMEVNAYHSLRELLHAKAEGRGPTQADIEAWTAASPYGAQTGGGQARGNQVAIIPLHGPMLNTVGELERFSGLTSTREFAQMVRAAADDPQVREIILDIDSPGGAATSVDAAADAVRYARERKPVTAVTEGLMASAAYWVGAQATRIVATPGAMVGSISVIYTHVDRSEMNAEMGVKVTHLATGDLKAAGNPDQPLDDTSRNELMRVAMDYHTAFVEAVAAGRGREPDFVQANWADGRVELGSTAKRLGMVDENGTLEGVIDEVVAAARAGGTSASTARETPRVEIPEAPNPVLASSEWVPDFQEHVEAFGQHVKSISQKGEDMKLTASQILQLFKDAPRMGAEADEPEGSRYVQLSETLVGQITAGIEDLQARNEELEKQLVARVRKDLAHAALTEADLPSAGADLDTKFQAKLEQVAINADTDDAARELVAGMIEERRELLAAREPAPANNPGIPDPDETPQGENPLRGIRSSFGL